MKKNLVLFDMDGTLTESRQKFDSFLLDSLLHLSEVADIGIVTGSDYDYLTEQMSSVIQHPRICNSLHLLPCNGTKYYKYVSDSFCLSADSDMRRFIGEKYFKCLMQALTEYQWKVSSRGDMPLTGNFISFRGSLVNWCPIGRNANNEDRKAFQDMDIENVFRNVWLDRLRRYMDHLFDGEEILTCKLGGDTSFDIYPAGWDKTFCLSHFDHYKTKWFVGDRCYPNGNDYEIYKELEGNSYKTSCPKQTEEIINDVILRIKYQ
jgi:phosphomannomutase